MLRTAAMACATLTKHHFFGSISASKPSLIVSHRTHLPILPIFPSRLYARMARRSPPPAGQNADLNQGSESEEDIESEMELELSDDDGGDESEDWEGFTMDFGALGKKKDDDNSDSEGSSS